MSSRKRKNRSNRVYSDAAALQDEEVPLDPALFIQAHEADILRGPKAKAAADSLEPSAQHLGQGSSSRSLGGLIRWDGPNLRPAPAFPSDSDDAFSSLPDKHNTASEQTYIWVDRYDARLLLDSLPNVAPRKPTASPGSPSGWSDLPSDSEDTFFFSPNETEDYRQEKRRKLMDQHREERLKARKAEDGETEEEDVWGGSDEEPDDTQKELMKRTASSILSTTNPAQLEMRILANYGADKRFGFLRGRWKRAWNAIKRETNADLAKKEETKGAGGLGNLADYGDSDEDDDEGDETVPVPDTEIRSSLSDASDGAVLARQARARAWAEKRRGLNTGDS